MTDLQKILRRESSLDFSNLKASLFDVETNGLYWEATKLHSLVINDINTDEIISCADHEDYVSLEKGLEHLEDSDVIIGHNITMFDIPVLKKLFPNLKFKDNVIVFDTLLMSRLMFPDITDKDMILVSKGGLPKNLVGKHGLEAWGYRLGENKGEFGKDSDWKEWSHEMQSYCVQDVAVNRIFFEKIHKMALEYSKNAIDIEHRFAEIISRQIIAGFPFNLEAAKEFAERLTIERDSFKEELVRKFPPKIEETVFIPKVNNSTRGYVKGDPFIKRREIPFNPGSRQQIAERLIEQGWEPQDHTEKGTIKVDEVILEKLSDRYPFAKDIARYMMLEKRLGQLANGKQALIKKVKSDGRMHGELITNGAVTGRCTHSNPNLFQTPSCSAEFGEEFRALYGPPPGMVQIGCDASGLELRCLAHYTHYWDEGKYTKIVTEGDVHTANQEAAGLPTRNNAKTFIYGWLYGAGDEKIGSIVMPLGSSEEKKKRGNELKTKFLEAMPAIAQLKEAISHKVKTKGYLIGIDGRKLTIRAEHAALNTLLQSAGAIVMKVANCVFVYRMEEEGYVWGKDWIQMANIHDEYQLAVVPAIADRVSVIAVEAIKEAGVLLNFNCPLDGEAKIGMNWAECH
jgi:DNA polymerase I